MKYWPYIVAIIYLLSPIDLLPEIGLGRVGLIDDVIVIFAAYFYYLYRPAFRKAGRRVHGDGGRESDEESGERPQAAAARDPYEVLGLPNTASPDEIKHAYRELANKYHPDKVSHLGEEFKQLAEKRFKKIDAAYKALQSK